LGTPTNTVTYTYGDEQWGDLLTAYDGNTITYDGVGNPLSDGEWNYTWKNGRQLASITNGSATWTYTYNADGMRTSKTNGSTTYRYVYNGSQLSQMTVGNNTLTFTYDVDGRPVAVTYNGTTYFYATNIQGDVLAIMDASKDTVVAYIYDAWGKLLSVTGDMANTLGAINPLRYRGYVYDTETGFYYLQSRYYNPEIGRFINVDVQLNADAILGYNMFMYCYNNPIMLADSLGTRPISTMTVQEENYARTANGRLERSISCEYMRETIANEHKEQKAKIYSYAATVYAEAGGENKLSKQAVAHVMNNRIGTRSSWTDIEKVISAPYQFAGYNSHMYQQAEDYYNNGVCNNAIDRAAMDECLAVVIPIFKGVAVDITGGATYFHSFKNPEDWYYHSYYEQVYIPGTNGFWFYKE